MRILRIVPLLITIILVYLLNKSYPGKPALGKLLDPINGCWVNAENVNKDYTQQFLLPQLQHPVEIWFDERLVPHIHAENDHDLYFALGYVHAYFRLWQMDMETRAAGGRVSEVVGEKTLKFDRTQRRKGMVFGAENSLRVMEADPRTKGMLDAYTAGINVYISSLKYRNYPLEYKLLSFAPEKWTNLKCALLLKYMADDLTGYTEDIPLTFLRDMLPKEDFDLLYPEKISGSTPVIPEGTHFEPASLSTLPVPNDSVWTHLQPGDFADAGNVHDGKGSNNWALSGMRTQSGAPILCNDPHLGLNLPSLWYEAQLQTPDMNVYGVSLPGAPGIVIGFNDSISWGLTNNYRDVKDFYAVEQVKSDSNSYWFDGKQVQFVKRVERIGINGKPDFIDTINYTVQGPVIYDDHFHGPGDLKRPLALCWMAHKSTNEFLALYLLDRAKNYSEFMDAIFNFQCPAQNMAYADKAGNIAIWGQGQFVNKWKGQGRYIMNGADKDALWKQMIPMKENPHVLNPERGYVSSANQSVTDSTYPYWYNGYFLEFRAWRINQVLNETKKATVQDMFNLQNDTYSVLAANTLPIMLRHMSGVALSPDEKKYLDTLTSWKYFLSANDIAATLYQVWWDKLYRDIWSDDFAKVPDNLWPLPERTMQLIQTDSTLKYYDDKNTPAVEGLKDMIVRSYKETIDTVAQLEKTTGLEWYKVKNTTVEHLAKLPAFSFADLKIGGWGNTVNAAKHDHGPSWRMVVQMSKDIEAYGVYPGGQSGNPGSKYYASFLQNWVDGKYYRLLFLPNQKQQDNNKVKYTLTLQPKS